MAEGRVTRDPDDPGHPLADALGVAGIGPTAIRRADGALVGALDVPCRQVNLRDEPRVNQAVTGLAELLASLPGPVQILVRNRAFDPTRHLADLAQHWSAGWADAHSQRLGHLGINRPTPTADGQQPTTYAGAVAAATTARLRQICCSVLLVQPPLRRPWWTRSSRPAHRRTQVRMLDSSLQGLGAQLGRAGWTSRRLRAVELHDLVEGAFELTPAPRSAVRHAVTAARRGAAGRHRIQISPARAAGFDVADPFPEWIKCHHDHLVIQGPGFTARWLRILALRGYPPEVEAGWLHWVATLPHDLDLALFVAPVADPAPRRSHAVARWPDDPDADPAVARALGRLVRTALLLGIGADTSEALQHATQDVRAELGTRGLRVSRALARQLDGLRSLLPLADNRLAAWRRIPAGPVAAALPLHAPGRADPGGIFLGATLAPNRGRAPVILNPVQAPNKHRHIAVLGRHGTDVTHSIMPLALGLWLQGASLAILDPAGTFGPLAKACGGRVVQPVMAGQAINIWDLAGVTDTRGFARAVRGLQDFWRLALPGLSVPQAAIVDAAIEPTYRQWQIEPADPATYARRPPTTADFVRAITAGYARHPTHGGAARELIERLRRLIHGPLAEVFDRLSTVALDRHCTVFDLRDPRAAQPDIPRLVAQVILRQLANRAPRARRGRIVVIDEVWPLLQAPQGTAVLRELATSAHTTSTTLLLGSRHVGDVAEHPGAEAILAACAAILLLPQHVRDAWLVRMACDLRYPHPETLERLQRGQGLAVFSDGARVALDVAGLGLDQRLFQGLRRPSDGDVPPREPGRMG